MDVLGIFRALGALTLLLGMLAGALWAVRRFDLRLPGALARHPDRRLELIERLGIDQRRSVVLIRRDDREHLVIISPEGQVVVETQPSRASDGEQTGSSRTARPTRPLPASFTALLDRDLTGAKVVDPFAGIPASKRKH